MSTLVNLKLVTAKKPGKLPPIVERRNKLSNKLWEQLQLAQAHNSGTNYAPIKQKRMKDVDGNIKTIEVPKRIKPWWFVSTEGKVCLHVRYGAKLIELAKGKTAIEVADAKDLIKTLELIKKAAEAGELDTQIEAVSGALKAGFKK